MQLTDSFGRTIDYLRVSLTDRCNLRCIYCMPEEGAPIAPKDTLLTDEELVRIMRIAVSLGMSKFRLTGGEPLVRPGVVKLTREIAALEGIQDLSLTTNAMLLGSLAGPLADAGMMRLNISLDTLKPERFQLLARRGNLQQVLDGIAASQKAGMQPIKINCVVMKGYNEDELVDFAKLSLDSPLHIRFIELMPINWSESTDTAAMQGFYSLSGASTGQNDRITLYADIKDNKLNEAFRLPALSDQKGMLNAVEMRRSFISMTEMRKAIESELGVLTPASLLTNGPAQTFHLQGGVGTVGFISQITQDMCKQCNRLRLTADGFLRPCLMADGEVDLRTPIREGASDEDIADLFRLTVHHKPLEHRLEDGLAPIGRNMRQLGG